MNQASVKKIIKKRKMKKHVSFVMKKSVKVMQGTAFNFSMINVISGHKKSQKRCSTEP